MSGERAMAQSFGMKTYNWRTKKNTAKALDYSDLESQRELRGTWRTRCILNLGSPPAGFRSRTCHDVILQTPLPNTLLPLARVPWTWCSFITKKQMLPTHCKLVFQPYRQGSCPASDLLSAVGFHNQASKAQDLLRRSATLYPDWEVTTSKSSSEVSGEGREWSPDALSLSIFAIRGIWSFSWSELGHMPLSGLGVKWVPPAQE